MRGSIGRMARATGLLLTLLLALGAGRSGLPVLRVHHLDAGGRMCCGCGCDCAQHPHSSDSCLNPLNRDVVCGCSKQHARSWEAPLPTFTDFLTPSAAPPPPPPRLLERLPAPRAPGLLAGFRTNPRPPH